VSYVLGIQLLTCINLIIQETKAKVKQHKLLKNTAFTWINTSVSVLAFIRRKFSN